MEPAVEDIFGFGVDSFGPRGAGQLCDLQG